jgi:hypothetical protein
MDALLDDRWAEGEMVPLPHRLSPEAGNMDRVSEVGHDEVEMVPLPPKLLTPKLTPEQNFWCRGIVGRA